jgi:hypothetical protein
MCTQFTVFIETFRQIYTSFINFIVNNDRRLSRNQSRITPPSTVINYVHTKPTKAILNRAQLWFQCQYYWANIDKIDSERIVDGKANGSSLWITTGFMIMRWQYGEKYENWEIMGLMAEFYSKLAYRSVLINLPLTKCDLLINCF